ncbi:MAG TPA: hypothetical protein VFG45_05775, partial [Candidatus Nitrosocosmicus sp.]|nr:hypothetical protein [Candidatus Nitrosocosmicus sp.]
GESQAIKIIDTQLRNSTEYLDWLQAQKWDGKLPLVTGSSGGGGGAGGAGANNLGAIPFIEIPLGGSTSNSESPPRTTNTSSSNGSTISSG